MMRLGTQPNPYSSVTLYLLLLWLVSSSTSLNNRRAAYGFQQQQPSRTNEPLLSHDVWPSTKWRHYQQSSRTTFITHQSSSSSSLRQVTTLRAGATSNSRQQEEGGGGGGTATIPNEIFNLIKSIIGAGVLSLPAGIAAYGNAPSAIIPATILITIMGCISGYTFSLIARICQQTNAISYSDSWNKCMSTKTSWLVSLSSTLDCLAGNLTYSMVLAETFHDLLTTLGIMTTRSNALLVLTSTILLPLCLVKNSSSLAPFSLIGILGMVYTGIVIAIRYFGKSYSTTSVPIGKFVSHLTSKPTFGSVGAMGAFSPKSSILISMLSTAYIAHFNAPKFYRELKNNTLSRFNIVVATSFGISILFYAAVTAMGFLTFGSATAGMILSNYSTQDKLLSLSRFAVGLSLIFSYPLLFVGARDGLLDLIGMPESKRTNILRNTMTVGLVAAITALALVVTDLAFVASMSGALLGTALIFIYPTLMFRAVVKKNPNATVSQRWESRLCGLIASIGVAIAGVGAKMAWQ